MGQIYINGKSYNFNEGDTILEVAKRNEIEIPIMCYLEQVTPTGACRLCLVEIEGVEKPVAACVTYALDNMRVKTDTEKVIKHRKKMMEFVLMKHPLDCPVCDKAGECMLQDTAYAFGITEETFKTEKPQKPKFDWDMIVHDANLCILCERCVKLCHEVAGCSALEIQQRGFENIINTKDGGKLDCDFCGMCVDYCPVGALLDKPYKHTIRSWDLEKKQTVCTMCPVGCEIEYGLFDGEIYRATACNDRFICSIGRYAFKYTDNPERLTDVLKNNGGNLEKCGFEEAIDDISKRVEKIINYYGEGAIAVLVGGSLSNEDLQASKILSEKIAGGKILSDLQFEYEKYFDRYYHKFNTYSNIGKLENLKTSELTFVIGSDLKAESLGVKWDMIYSPVRNDGKLVVISLSECEYEYVADAVIKADYADFAGVFEKIKSSNDELYKDIRGYIEKASKVSFIVGNEYMQGEKQLDAVFSFVDFVGKNKLYNFINTNDRANFSGVFNILGNGYNIEAFANELKNGEIKGVFTVGFYNYNSNSFYKLLKNSGKNLELLVSLSMFKDSLSKGAHYIFPVQSYLETDGSFVTLDNRLIKASKVVEPPINTYKISDIISKFASSSSKFVGVKSLDSAKEIFDNYISGKYGFSEIKYSEIDGYIHLPVTYSYNKTDFKYKEFSKGTVEIYVNERHQSGILTTKAALEKKDGEVYRKYYFDVKNEILSGKDACFDGKCRLDTKVADGVILIPKNIV
jgi:NADH dehydrogenase/NADH:ubiquinone oxidoreductase subunit G